MSFTDRDSFFPQCTFGDLIASGGDERLALNKNNENKYYINPLQGQGVFNRGSCTNSPLTQQASISAQALHTRLRQGSITFEDAMERQRQEVLQIYDPLNTHGTDLIFSPSGSDLCYLPLLFSRLIKPDKEIINLVTCKEELGSGSLLAHQGQYYASISQLSDQLQKGDLINPNLKISYIPYSARGKDGRIVSASENIRNNIREYANKHSVIVSLVIGSKSGIEDSLSIIDELKSEPVIWSVDLCQMRATPSLARHLLQKDCLLFITGSKFYQAPAFCGGMLISGRWVEQLSRAGLDELNGFDKLFTSYDFPPSLSKIGARLKNFSNIGLLLRWRAALTEMKLFNELPQRETQTLIENWHRSVVNELYKRAVFEPMHGQDITNKSIISFRLKTPQTYLTRDQMAKIHKIVATTPKLISPQFDKVLIGQPVNYESGTFLRFALGASDVREFHDDGFDMRNDMMLINAIERLALEIGR